MFLEVNHGPLLVDNNIFLSAYSLNFRSKGVAFVHNLFAGATRIVETDARTTPYHTPHSTNILGMEKYSLGDDRYYNNIFIHPPGLQKYNNAELPVWMEGNVFLKGAEPSGHEENPVVIRDYDPDLKIIEENGTFYLEMKADPTWSSSMNHELVTTELLGKALLPGQAYTNPDGSSLRIDNDFLGKPRNPENPTPGPFEDPGSGKVRVKVW